MTADFEAALVPPVGLAADAELAGLAGERAPDVLVMVDSDGRILWASHAAEVTLGWPVAELRGLQVEMLIPEAKRGGHVALRGSYHATAEPRPIGVGLELTALHRDGREIPVEIGLSSTEFQGQPVVLAAVRDRSPQIELERELYRSNLALERSSERSRIALDLHDTVSQDLYALGLGMSRLAKHGGASSEDLSDLIDQLDGAIRHLSTAIFELREPGIEAGLGVMVRAIVRHSERALGFAPALLVVGDFDRVEPWVASHVGFVLRELLSNVARHAQATGVVIDMVIDRELEIEVRDDGIGWPLDIDAIGGSAAPGVGLEGIQTRAQVLGGSFDRFSPPGGGAGARFRAPLGED